VAAVPRAARSDEDLEYQTGSEPRSSRPGRALGFDLGSRRIGVALSDDSRRVATALTVLVRGGSHAEDHIGLARILAEAGATVVVVGLPVSLDGSEGPAAASVRAEVGELRLVLSVPVELADERYSTVLAQQALAAGGRRGATQRAVVDQTAATVILQGWLDRGRPAPPPGAAALPTPGPYRWERPGRPTSRRAR